MKVTLRKAHRLVKELQQKSAVRFATKAIHHSASDQEVLNTINSVNSESFNSVETALAVQDVIYEIRKSLHEANSKEVDGNSIDSLLSEKALIEGRMKTLALFREKSKTTDEENQNKILREVQDNHTSTSEYRNNYTNVSGLSAVMHDNFNSMYVQAKQDQERVSDKLAYINNKLEIEIDDKFKELFKVLQVL